MGLDMYIFKRTSAEGHSVRQVQKLSSSLELVKNYEELSDLIANDGEKLNIDHFWTINMETPEEKRERLLRSIPEQLEREKEAYRAAKILLTPENIALAESYSEKEVAYWRKANQIHNWFVNNVQEGEDDCDYYNLTQDKIQELVDLCQNILDIAEDESLEDYEKESRYEELLPTQGGFFFGGTNYDEYYLSDIRSTIEQLKPLLEKELQPHERLLYHASW